MTIATFEGTKNTDVTIGLVLGGLAATLAAELDWLDPNTYARTPIHRTDPGGSPMRTWTISAPYNNGGRSAFQLIVTPATISGPSTVNATLQVRQNGADISGSTDDGGTPIKSPWVSSISTTTASAIEFYIHFS